MSTFRRYLPWLLLALLAQPAQAGMTDTGTSPFTLSGFGTLGLARSDSDTAEYVRDLSQPRGLTQQWSARVDSVLGLQGNLRLDEQTDGVVQIISRYRYDGSHTPEVSWAFLRHDFSPDLQARAGRLGTEFYMLADSRLIGYANLAVRPPPDFFAPLIFSYFDGLDATASTSLGKGVLRAKLFAGRSPESSPFVDPDTWNMAGSRLMGGHLDYYTGPWQFRIGHAEVRFSGHELPLNILAGFDIVALAPELSIVHKTASFDSLGAVYDQGPLRIQAMMGRIRHKSAAYEDSRAAFALASYRLGAYTPYAGYSIVKSSASTLSSPLPPLVDAIARGLLTASHMDQHTLTLGTRWDFRQDWDLKLQFDAVRGKPSSTFPFRGPNVQWDGRMNVVSLALDFAF